MQHLTAAHIFRNQRTNQHSELTTSVYIKKKKEKKKKKKKEKEEKTHYKQIFNQNHIQHECRASTPEHRIALRSKRSIIILILKSKDASWPENVENEQIFTSASKEEKKNISYFYKSKILH